MRRWANLILCLTVFASACVVTEECVEGASRDLFTGECRIVDDPAAAEGSAGLPGSGGSGGIELRSGGGTGGGGAGGERSAGTGGGGAGGSGSAGASG